MQSVIRRRPAAHSDYPPVETSNPSRVECQLHLIALGRMLPIVSIQSTGDQCSLLRSGNEREYDELDGGDAHTRSAGAQLEHERDARIRAEISARNKSRELSQIDQTLRESNAALHEQLKRSARCCGMQPKAS